ncbi:MAG: molybdenum cofactor guanylyltransferase, partial [Clostridiales bacterium]
ENGQEIADIYPNHGPLGGIHAGLSYAKYDYCFISSCDLPNFHGGLAAYLLSQASGYDLVLPCIDGFFQPLFAVIHRRVLPIIEAELLNGENNKVMFVYRKMKMRIIEKEEILPFGDPQELFYNINTPLDYQKKPF